MYRKLFAFILTFVTLLCFSALTEQTNGAYYDYLAGDVTADGSVNMADVVALRRFLINSEIYPLQNESSAEVTGEGSINMADVVALRRYLVNSSEYPLHSHSYEETIYHASCTEDGYTEYRCSDCGHSYVCDYITAPGHIRSGWTVVKEPTYTEKGTEQNVCIFCGDTISRDMDRLVMTEEYKQQEVLRIVNEERAKEGLKPLTYAYTAQAAADVRAAEIVQSFSHTRPNGTRCFTALNEAGVSYRTAGENIAYGYFSPEAVMTGWMNSEGHRANILNASFTSMEIGLTGNYWVQFFLG
jgi:uncharacterized protein YkwD